MKRYENLIFNLKESPLDTVQHHKNFDSIKRYFADDFPLHMAIHSVNQKEEVDTNYTELHTHEVDELNIIISNSKIVYNIQIEDDVFHVEANSGVWIPAGLKHSANIIQGTGFFVAIRLDGSMNTYQHFDQNMLETNEVLRS